jgi:hypothetical protein
VLTKSNHVHKIFSMSTLFTRILFELNECNAHRLPTRTSAGGFTTIDFSKEVLSAQLFVKTWSFEKAAVEIYVGGKLFAACPLMEENYSCSVERTADSSRYFVLKVMR